jgi:two-component system chemotaxis response regulator CheY
MAHVLTVDDSISLRKLVVSTLTSAGHSVVEASNGAEALAELAKRGFNLVISDINMPVMDGLTFVKRVREGDVHKHIPILLLTTEMDPSKKKQAKESGATGWLVKPFEPEQLLATIRKVLG